jgi:hypothetical protein
MKWGVPIVLLGVLAVAGCFPRPVPNTPPIGGTLVDATNLAPISGAQVDIQPLAHSGSDPIGFAVHVLSDRDGRFHAEATNDRMWLPPLPFDFFYPEVRITISAAGYMEHTFVERGLGPTPPDPQRSPDGATFYLKKQ